MAPGLHLHRLAAGGCSPSRLLRSSAIVAGQRRRAHLLADLVVALALEALDELDAALEHDPPVHQDVDELRLDVVQDALVVGDDQGAEALLVVQPLDALGDRPQGVDVEARVGLVEDRDIGCRASPSAGSRRASSRRRRSRR